MNTRTDYVAIVRDAANKVDGELQAFDYSERFKGISYAPENVQMAAIRESARNYYVAVRLMSIINVKNAYSQYLLSGAWQGNVALVKYVLKRLDASNKKYLEEMNEATRIASARSMIETVVVLLKKGASPSTVNVISIRFVINKQLYWRYPFDEFIRLFRGRHANMIMKEINGLPREKCAPIMIILENASI